MTTLSIGLSQPQPFAGQAPLETASLLARLARWCQGTWCVINGGHYKVLHTEPLRLALKCVACGHTSPGWAVGSPRLARTMPGDPERLRLRRPAA